MFSNPTHHFMQPIVSSQITLTAGGLISNNICVNNFIVTIPGRFGRWEVRFNIIIITITDFLFVQVLALW